MMMEKALLVILGIFMLCSVTDGAEKEEPYKIYEEYKKILKEDKEVAGEIDRVILQQEGLKQEIANLKFVKEIEVKILNRWKKEIKDGGGR